MRFINKISFFLKQYKDSSSIIKGFFVLGIGSVLAQAIMVLTMPIITRLYSPVDFGIFAIFNSIISILTVFVSFRYDWAIPIPKNKIDAINLFALCFFLLSVTSFFLILIFGFIGFQIFKFFNMESILPYYVLLIIAFVGIGIYNIMLYWALRNKDYNQVSYTRINQSISGSIIKIGLGLLSFGPLGLIIGQIVTQIAGIGTFFTKIFSRDRNDFKEISFKKMRQVGKHFLRYPLYSLPASFLNSISSQFPILLFSIIFGLQSVGYYALAFSVLVLPASIIQSSIGQVYFSEVASLIHSKPSDVIPLQKGVIKKLFVIGIIIVIIPALIAPWMFPLIFGQQWQEPGLYCIPLSLGVFANLVVGPISNLDTYGFSHWQLLFEGCKVVITFGIFGIILMFKVPIIPALLLISVSLVFANILNYFLNTLAIKKILRNS